jgi:hypothetical protein
MSEQHRPHHEQSEKLPHHEHVEHKHSQAEHEPTHAEKQHGNQEHLERLSKAVEQNAISGKELSNTENEQPNNHPVLVNSHLKAMAFSRAMTRARKKLSAPSRAFSKVAHSSIVDKPSEFIGKTIARPAAMMWGAVFAFVGTSTLLWITKHYGYEYNYLLVVLLFVAGAILGTALEGLTYLLRKRNR